MDILTKNQTTNGWTTVLFSSLAEKRLAKWYRVQTNRRHKDNENKPFLTKDPYPTSWTKTLPILNLGNEPNH